ncbi:acetoacetate--CoA ligase, partial [Beggiatoa alba]|nr:acetoacetate--CoA ligase [Beggiatoa alba]
MTDKLWQPDPISIQSSRLHRFMLSVLPEKQFSSYSDIHQWSVAHRELFWQAIWEFFSVKHSQKWQQILDEPQGMFMSKWFTGSRLNFAENLLQYGAINSNKIALEFYNEKGDRQSISYAELYKKVAVLAAAFRHSGLKPGDRVAAVLPNIPEAVIAMLACTSVGAIWSCCSADFGLNSLIDRFSQIKPTIFLYCAAYYYKGKICSVENKIAALIKTLAVRQVVVIPYIHIQEEASKKQLIGIQYSEYIKETEDSTLIKFEPLPFDHPIYILYSSGTTGIPKCIVHGAGGTLLQHLKELGLHVDLNTKDKLFYYTTTGWMMWNWQVSALALGATVVLYDGSPFYPEPQSLLDLVSQQNISVFGCSAKYISALAKARVNLKEDLQSKPLRMILSTGSPLVAESFDYVYKDIKSELQLCSISGGTDIVSCFALGNPFSAVYRGELQGPGLAMAVEIYNKQGQPVLQQKGELVCRASFPSMPVYFWNDPQNKKYHHAYFENFQGVWTHGDYAEISEHQGMIIYGRSDATLNPGGVRIGTAEIYRQLEAFSQIVDALAVGQSWQGDQRIILFVQLQQKQVLEDALIEQIKQAIRNNTSVHHVPCKI